MTKEELKVLNLNQRVRMFYLDKILNGAYLYGYVTKIYNGNYQVQVWFDGKPKPIVVGYTQIDIFNIKKMNLIEGLQKEMNRVREIIKEYDKLPNNAGAFASGMLKFSIESAEHLMAIGDTIGMMKAYNHLKEYRELGKSDER